MRRLWLSVLVLCGLAAASLHAPAMALPRQEPASTVLHADCHSEAPAASAGDPVPADPTCCPDGCSGGCLLPGALMPPRSVAPRVPVSIRLSPPPPGRPASRLVEALFHPPRTFA